ncbi:hypothetical protein FA95DRAFT_1545043 [Auriscalpium vulgare]|uniref:Uncharacterized protein n=1 Tax=Auriscalpium vulgare TaxID=40419 RepID=A0ACB8RKX5_9AGAM|nr:hypothetical protein FA95DRAFT_1545043 [Auriscalpium vulgare]
MASGSSANHADAEPDDSARSLSLRPRRACTKKPAARPVDRTRCAGMKKEHKAIGQPRAKRGRLSVLPTLPLEILHEIFGHLPPDALIKLTRTSKAFRQFLLSRQSLFLWRDSYNLVPDAPPCPDDMSVRAWAHLLFGGAYCYTCGTKNVSTILFVLRRRACNSCAKKHLLDASDASELFGVTLADLKGIPHIRYNSVSPCYWWDEDLDVLREELDALLARHRGKKSAAYKSHLDEVRAAKKAATDVKLKHHDICQIWDDGRARKRTQHLTDIKEKRFEDIKTRLLALDYAASEIDAIRGHREVLVPKPMTDRVWARISQALVDELLQRREREVQLDRRVRKITRHWALAEAWAAYARTLPAHVASIVVGLPYPHSIPSIAAAIEPDEDRSPALEMRIKAAILDAHSEVMERIRSSAERLLALLPLPSPVPSLSTETALSNEFLTGTMGGLALATSQFTCDDYCFHRLGGSTGMEMFAHFCEQPRFSEARRDVVLRLLDALHMDPETTTTHDLDRTEAQFVCMQCPVAKIRRGKTSVIGRNAMYWRACVTHSATMHELHAGQWRLLNETEARLAREWFVPRHPRDSQPWGCGHCTFHLNNSSHWHRERWLSQTDVLAHVKAEHAILAPVLGVDYIHNPLTSFSNADGALAMDT